MFKSLIYSQLLLISLAIKDCKPPGRKSSTFINRSDDDLLGFLASTTVSVWFNCEDNFFFHVARPTLCALMYSCCLRYESLLSEVLVNAILISPSSVSKLLSMTPWESRKTAVVPKSKKTFSCIKESLTKMGVQLCSWKIVRKTKTSFYWKRNVSLRGKRDYQSCVILLYFAPCIAMWAMQGKGAPVVCRSTFTFFIINRL